MVPAKINPMSITTIREKDLESIIDWFDQHKQSFYALGLAYVRDQQQMEEIFYRSILKVQKGLPRFNGETSFELLVASIFIHTCRELSDDQSLQVSEEGEPRQDLYKALDLLTENEKEAVVLTYVKGISQEEVTYLLQVSLEKMKELLFSGIQSLRKDMGYESSINGCKEYHQYYIDYLERTLDRSKKIDFEMHIYHCKDCQVDLGTYQEVILNLTKRFEDFNVPSGFMENVENRLAEKEKQRQKKNKKRIRMGLIFASVSVLLIGIAVFTGAFTNLYYTWTEENQELRAFLQQGWGERLNLEAESNGVKIKIKSAIADDVQTLVFYEIEDTAEDNQYVMDYHEGVFVENKLEILNRDTNPRYYTPDLKSDLNNKEKNLYHGKISLLPLKTDKGTIKLKITKLQKLIRDSSEGVYENMEYETGEWDFEIPVTKLPSVEYALDEETEVEGIPVRFDKLTIAPTATILNCAFLYEPTGKRVNSLNLGSLMVNNKKVKADMYGNYFIYQNDNWVSFQTHFDPLFVEKPKEVDIQFQSVHLTVEDKKTIELDAFQKYPQTFDYAGSTISIDKVEVGQPTHVVISNHEIENRAYDWIHFEIVGEDENEISAREMNSEGVIVDKNGIEYDMNQLHVDYDEIEQPRYFLTVENIKLYNTPEESVIPKRLEIYEYHVTKYLDDVVTISLE